MSGVTVKTGVQFTRIAPAGFRLLGALERTARRFEMPLVITCACEAHPAADPHAKGEAYDVRTHGLTPAQKALVLRETLLDLSDGEADAPMLAGLGAATRRFYGQIEHAGTPAEHLHVQRRKGTTYR
jgi:hypothetical protein